MHHDSRTNNAALSSERDLLLSPDDWKQVLMDPKIFSCEALRMILFVYNQERHRATPSAIARGLSTSCRKINYAHVSAWNRDAGRALYRKFHIEPPRSDSGCCRYCKVIFEDDARQPLDKYNHAYWRLRKSLVTALQEMV